MKTISVLAQEFLSQKTIAVVGVSAKKETPANAVYKKLKAIARSRKAQKEFLSLFNFDFEHTGYSKDAEELGVI